MSTISWVPPEVYQGTTTSWLPVTTAYPSLPGCASAFFYFPYQPAPAAWDPGYGYFAGATLSCLPPQQTKWWEQEHENPDGYTKLSIQPIVCPAAFTTAATELRSDSSTLVKCCPSGYDLSGGQPGRIIGDCYSAISSGQVITYTGRNETNFVWGSSTTTFASATKLWGIPMEGWTVNRAATGSSPTATSTSTSTSLPTSTPISNPDSSASSSLSTGARAGIGAGIAIGVIACACLLFLFFRRHRRSRSNFHHETTSPPPPFHYGQDGMRSPLPPVEADYMNQKWFPVEMSVPVQSKYSSPVELGTR